MTKIKVPLFRLFIIPLLISFGGVSPSFGEDTNIRILERKFFPKEVLVNRICIGGYEFVSVCTIGKLESCDQTYNHQPNPYQLSQIITEDGGGKKC